MKPWTLIPAMLLALGIAATGGCWWGDVRGHARGVLETQARHDAKQVDALTTHLTSINDEIAGSAAANRQVRDSLTRIERTNRTSNQELRDELEKIPGRVQCHFDAGVMRIINAAADRADALAASGVSRTLPASREAER